MKHEMMRAAHQCRQASNDIDAMLEAIDATDRDRDEVKRFADFLKDSASMALPELIDKHGANYLGFTSQEVESLRPVRGRSSGDLTKGAT